MTRRLVAAALWALVVGAGLCVHFLLANSAFSDIAGDALYSCAAYLTLVILAPRWRPLVTAAVAIAWCVAVELFQLTGIPLQAGAAFPPAMLVLGTVFDPRDLVIAVGAISAAALTDVAVETAIRLRRVSSPQPQR